MTFVPPRVLDAAIGTALGSDGAPTDALCWTAPDRVRALHEAHLHAGAEVTKTNTFMIAARDDGARLAQAATALARGAWGDRDAGSARIWGSMGPGARSLSGAIDAFRDTGVEALLIESFTDLAAHLRAIDTARTAGFEVVASFCFLPGAPPPDEVARALSASGAVAIAANCGVSPAACAEAALAMSEVATVPVFAILPGAWRPDDVGTEDFDVPAWAARAFAGGVAGVGGCCGTTDETVRAIREAAPR